MKSVKIKVESKEGIIGLWEETGEYTINFSDAHTIDNMITSITTNLPEEYKVLGMKVIFSGTLSKNKNTPFPKLGGQSIFNIKLKKINKSV